MSTSRINYKLALELKKAGFPQGDISSLPQERYWIKEEVCYIPTLSELIEATKQKGRELSFDECNERWGSKYNHDKGIFERDENGKVIEELKSPYQWEAKLEDWNSKEYGKRRCYEAGDEVVAFTGGKTPEEAVANLYIKLNS